MATNATNISADFTIPSNSGIGTWDVGVERITGSNLSLASGFTIISNPLQPPTTPVLQTPATGATNQPVPLTLTWGSVTGATTYRMQVATDGLFTALVVNDSTLTTPSKQVSSLLNNTKYYWRVNAKNISGTSSYSTVFSFTTIAQTSTITSITPNTAMQGQTLTVTITGQNTDFIIGSGSSAINNVWFSQGSSTIYATSFLATNATNISADFTIPSNASTGKWDVGVERVTGSNLSLASGFTIIPNPLQPPTVPVLQTPATGSTNQAVNLTVSWNASADATSYRLQVSTDQNFGTIVYDQSNITGTSQAVTWLLNGTTYYWRVNASNAGGTSSYSTVFNFTTIAQTSTITSISPDTAMQGQTLTVTITGQNTDFIIGSGSSTINNIWFSQGSSTINATSFLATNATKVSADFTIPSNSGIGTWDVNVAKVTGSVLPLKNGFTVIPNPLQPPSNLSATVISGSQINLSWTDASNNEDGFKVERKLGAGGTYALIATLGANVQSYSNTGLAESTTFYYRIFAYNTVGNSGYSNETNATTKDVTAPAAPTAAQIVPSGWTNQNTFNITWTNPSDPSGIAKLWYIIDTIPTVSSPGKAIIITTQTLQGNISSAGIHQIYFYLEDGAGNKNPANIASVNLKYDNIPPIIQDDSLNVQMYNADNPQSIAINASANDVFSGIRSIQLQYHRAGTSWSTATTLNYGSITGGSASIPLSDLSSYSKEGIDYRIYAQDSAGNITYSPTHSIAIRYNTQFGRTDPSGNPITQVSTSSLTSGIPLEYAYRMFSVPLDLDDKTPKTILESKTGLGTYDQKQWRFYSLDTANDSLSEYPDFSSQAVVTPGRAFLLILKTGTVIKTGSGSIIKSEDIAKNGLPLKSGYNFIGNPFNYDIPIDSLSIANGMSLTGRTWQYVGTGGTNGGWLLNPPKLLAWEGIVINLGQNGPTTLRFRVADRPQTLIKSSSYLVKKNVVYTNSDTLSEWKTIIRASRLDNGAVDEENVIGVSPEVSDSTNALNCFEPPLIGDKNISVSFESPDGTLTHDFRSIADTGWIWNMKVLTTDKNADLRLDFTDLHKQKGFL